MIDNSTLFDLLTNDARRRILLTMCDAVTIHAPEGFRTRGASATTSPPVAWPHSDGDWSNGTAVPRSEDIQLYHVHLPKLARAGVVDWDPRTGTVTRGPAFEDVEPALRLLATNPQALPDGSF